MARRIQGRSRERVVLVVACLTIACQRGASNPALDLERRAVSEWVRIPGSSVVASKDVSWTGTSLSETWELSVPLTWIAYRGRLRDAVWGGYHEVTSDDARQVFVRTSSGDAFSLSLDLVSPGPPLRVRVTFTATPD